MLMYGISIAVFFLPTIYSQCQNSVTLTTTSQPYVFTSPDYPNTPYSSGCQTKVTGPAGSSLKVKCPVFEIPSTWWCWGHYLSITSSAGNNKYCGTPTVDQTYATNEVTLSYSSCYAWTPFQYPRKGVQCTVSVLGGSSCTCGLKKAGTRIVGGVETDPNEYPWQALVQVGNNPNVFCGGSIISNMHIMTAAHCTDGIPGTSLKVTLGEHDRSTPDTISKVYMVSKVTTHESYSAATDDNDIALLKLTEPITYSAAVQPVCLPFGLEMNDLTGLKGTITGWGLLKEGGSASNVLMEVDLTFLTSQLCKSAPFAWGSRITNNMICGTGGGTKDTCMGDSGGPFVWEGSKKNHFQMGIVSFGRICADLTNPGVYTKVTNYLNWIKEKTGLDSEFCRAPA